MCVPARRARPLSQFLGLPSSEDGISVFFLRPPRIEHASHPRSMESLIFVSASSEDRAHQPLFFVAGATRSGAPHVRGPGTSGASGGAHFFASREKK